MEEFYVIFNNKYLKVKDQDIVYLCEYIPKSRNYEKAQRSEASIQFLKLQDQRSEKFVLTFKNQGKNGHKYVVQTVADTLLQYLVDGCALAAVPPSDAAKNGQSAAHELIQCIISTAGRSLDIVDASNCLYRKHSIDSQHKHPEKKRNIEVLRESTGIRDYKKIDGRDVLVIDDITTTGNSFIVADDLLKQHGAAHVVNFAVGKTIGIENMNVGFILDLDGTLFNTEKADWDRSCRNWEKAIEKVTDLNPLPGAEELLHKISDLECKYCVVTSSPAKYAHVLTHKLGIPDSLVITYHDTEKHKPDIAPYMYAKKVMQLYEPFIIVIGNSDSDIIPAVKLNMTSVLLESKKKKTEDFPFRSVDFQFANIAECVENFDDILKNARNVWDILSNDYEKNHAPKVFSQSLYV